MFVFSDYVKSLDKRENYIDLRQDIIETIIDPCIRYSKRIKNRDLFFVVQSFDDVVGPSILIKENTHDINVTRQYTGNVIIPINIFECIQIKDNLRIKTLKTLEESNIIINAKNYFILNLNRIYDFMSESRFNRYNKITDIKDYKDLINILETFKDYYLYRGGQ